MERAGIDSLNQMATKTGVAVATLAALVHGERKPSVKTVEAVQAVFTAPDAGKVPKWAGLQWNTPNPVLPDGARALTPKQWSAVEAVIASMIEPGKEKPDESSPTKHLRVAARRQPNAPPKPRGSRRGKNLPDAQT